MNSAEPSINPIGFQYNASKNLPCKSESTDLVDPQEGQGIFVTCLNMQTSIPLAESRPEVW